MNGLGGATGRALRPDPFALWSETTLRFAVLMAAVLGSTLVVGLLIFNNIPRLWEYSQREQARISAESHVLFPSDEPKQVAARKAWVHEQDARPRRIQAAWIVGWGFLVFGVAYGLYRLHPQWKIRRDHLNILSGTETPDTQRVLEGLVKEAGLESSPVFMWNPLRSAIAAQAFGRHGHYRVALSGGAVMKSLQDPDGFRALVLHELGHIKNGDIGKTYFAISIWWAFILAGLVPLAAVIAFFQPSLERLWIVWPIGSLAILVFLLRNSILRAREFYADLRVSSWDNQCRGALERILGSLARPRLWETVFMAHPTPDERIKVLRDLSRLPRCGFWVSAGTAAAATLALPIVGFTLGSVFNITTSFYEDLIAGLLLVGPASLVPGLTIWNGTFESAAQREGKPGAGKMAAGFALGCLLGQFGSTTAYAMARSGLQMQGLIFVVFSIAWGLFAAAGLFVILRWNVESAGLWLRRQASLRQFKIISCIGATIAAILFSWWIGFVFYIHNLSLQDAFGEILRIGHVISPGQTDSQIILGFIRACFDVPAAQPAASAVIAIVVVFPLVGWILLRGASNLGVKLIGSMPKDEIADLSSREYARTILTGLGCGLLLLGLLFALSRQKPIMDLSKLIDIAVLFPVIPALVLGFKRDRNSMLPVFAACITCCFAVLGIWIALHHLGCPAKLLWPLLRKTANEGVLLVLVIASVQGMRSARRPTVDLENS